MANRWTHQAGTDPYNQFATPRDDKLGKVRDPLLTASRWLKRRSQKEKVFLGSVCGLLVSQDNLVNHLERSSYAYSSMLLRYRLWCSCGLS